MQTDEHIFWDQRRIQRKFLWSECINSQFWLLISGQCALALKRVNWIIASWIVLGGLLPAVLGEVILPLCSALMRPLLECCVKFWAPQYKTEVELLDEVQQRATKMIKRLEYPSSEIRELGLLSLEKSHISETRVKRGQSQAFFSGAHWQDKRQWAQTENRRISLNIRKHFFTVRVTRHWTDCPVGLWSLPPRTYSKAVYRESWATVFRWPCLSRGLEQDDLYRFLPTSDIL